MRISLRALLVLVALPLMVTALLPNLGFYTTGGMVLMLVAGVLVLVAALGKDLTLRLPQALPLYVGVVGAVSFTGWHAAHAGHPLLAQLAAVMAALALLVGVLAYLGRVRPADPLAAGLLGLGVLLSAQAALSAQLRFAGHESGPSALLMLLVAGPAAYLVWLSFLAPARPVKPGGWYARWALLLVLGLTMRGAAIIGSPDPIIDVNPWLQHAPRFLLSGQNPYATDYPTPYGTPRAMSQGINDPPNPRPPTYPPLTVLTGVPAVLAGVDVRWMNVLADGVAAVLILLMGLKCRRWDLGVLASGAYLCLPRAPFLIEQAWFEPQLAALAGVLLVWGGARPVLAGVALGGLLAGKQYAVALLPATISSLRRQPRTLAVGLLVALAVTVPFVLWSPAEFWRIVVAGHLGRPVVYHALTMAALLHNEAGLTVPPVALWVVMAGLLGLVAWKAPAQWTPQAGLYLGASLLAFSLFHTQGFFNYYYLVLFLLLMGLVGSHAVAGPPSASADEAGYGGHPATGCETLTSPTPAARSHPPSA